MTIDEKLDDIYTDLEHNVTKVFGRHDLHTAIDLAFHSVLGFNFMGVPVRKGWVEVLIIGDTRCGKSETAMRLLQHYAAGELVSGENATRAGLLGGLQQNGRVWSLTWGKIPRNDKRLVVLDEISGLSYEAISDLSGVRSSGIAEVTGIQTERTRARCRMIWMANPRSPKPLRQYNYGVEAVMELIGRPEDVARFDLVTTAAAGEVSEKLIRSEMNTLTEHKYTSALCHSLIMWCWSRKPDQVRFEPKTEDVVWDLSRQLAEKYTSRIPIIEPSEQRIKLARLAAALAGRLFSTETGEDLIVRREHVEWVAEFLNKCLSKPSLGYDEYSLTVQERALSEAMYEQLAGEFLDNFRDPDHLANVLLSYSRSFRRNQLQDELGYDRDDTTELIKWMRKNKLIETSVHGFRKTGLFIEFLRRWRGEDTNGHGLHHLGKVRGVRQEDQEASSPVGAGDQVLGSGTGAGDITAGDVLIRGIEELD